ncbi:hypothetical protein [Reinekea marinisedimentorum]|uniref:Lipoprotein n=1 Tax=Reinekea marinisedimentorum TaxID=230495 RepID=A0A4R3I9K0_9GAMM|nr:hypothetical protein [Reinekea marinisedimentorum]TCS42060.1 hypothetical protein BCF53_104164 [Reinekea marinisedimentorum]
MKNQICIFLTAFALTGCATTLSTKDPAAYEESYEQAKVTLKTNNALGMYEKYYNKPDHKAWAQSKGTRASSYVTNKTTADFAIELALENCNQQLLKKYDEVSDRIACEIINVDNQWVSK